MDTSFVAKFAVALTQRYTRRRNVTISMKTACCAKLRKRDDVFVKLFKRDGVSCAVVSTRRRIVRNCDSATACFGTALISFCKLSYPDNIKKTSNTVELANFTMFLISLFSRSDIFPLTLSNREYYSVFLPSPCRTTLQMLLIDLSMVVA